MRIFLWLLVLFATAIGLAVLARFNPGNVVLFYPPYRIDVSLNFFLLLLALLFMVAYALLKAIRTTQQMPARVALYRREKKDREGNQALRDALKALFEGRFGHSEKAAARAAELPANAGLAALIGARAAHRMQQSERRDAWLARVADDNSLRTARLMIATELLIDGQEPQKALEAVNELNASGTRHIHALRLALTANQHAKNWPEVLRLVRTLDKNKAVHPALAQRLRELGYEDLLSNGAHDAESIQRIWASIPQQDRLRPFVALRAADAFNAHGLHGEAGARVEKALAAEWDERLVRAWRESAEAEGSAGLLGQIERCEQWRRKRPQDPELALTLGVFCLKQKLWGKAQQHLEQALSDATAARTVREAHLRLAQLHEALNQPERAAAHYRQCALATIL
jgi:HemY protein